MSGLTIIQTFVLEDLNFLSPLYLSWCAYACVFVFFVVCVCSVCLAFCVPGRRGADYFQMTLNWRWKEGRHMLGGLVGQNGHSVKVVKKLATWSIVTLWS